MIHTLRTAFYKHGYLLIIAAWLYTISFVITNYWAYDSSPVKVKDKLEFKLTQAEKSIQRIAADTNLLQLLVTDTASDKKLDLTKQAFGLFLYKTNDVGSPILTYWNNNTFTIPTEDLLQKDGYYFATRQNGEQEVIKQTISLPNKKILLVAVIPIRWSYFIDNDYLHKDFDGFPKLSEQYEISNDTNALPIINSQRETLFKISQKEGHIYAGYDFFTILLRVLFVLALIMFLNRSAIDISRVHGARAALLLLVSVVGTMRIITYYFPFPFDFSRLSLFDPSVYASNAVHSSLGQLLVNSILLFWIVGFWKFSTLKSKPSYLYAKYTFVKYLNIVLLVALAFAMTRIISTLILDSKISFDVTHFFSLTLFSVVSFVVLAFLGITFYHLSHVILRPVLTTNTPLHFQLLSAVIAGLFYITFTISTATELNFLILLWVIIYLVIINSRKQDSSISIQKSSFFLFWIMFFALSITLLISWQNQTLDLSQRKKTAERVVLQNDANGENVLSIALSNINEKALESNFPRLLKEVTNKKIKDSIINENFTGYLNRFETSIYTFNQFYQPLFNEDTTFNYPSLTSIIFIRSKQTDVPNLYTWENSPDQVSYIYSITIGSQDNPMGYLFLVAKPKKYKSEALYPVLFSQSDDDENFTGQNDYAKALYLNGRLISKSNDYDFPLKIKPSKLLPHDFAESFNGNAEELWYNAGKGKVVVIAQTQNRFIELVTLFAYLFFTFLVLIASLYASNYILRANITKSSLRNIFGVDMQSQIHATVIFISVFSFVVIGAATILYFINRFDETSQQRLSSSIEAIANEVTGRLQQVESQKLLDDSIYTNDAGLANSLERNITAVSEAHNVDINFYSLSGSLIASTQPNIYSKQLLNSRINPKAYYHLLYDGRSHFVQKESIGNLEYLSMYMPILDDAGEAYAYINIPYLNSQLELNQEISSFIATIINLNAFIFLIAGAISFLITQRVVVSFSIIANKMKEVSIGKKNEAIVWKKKDEIGGLVAEYNKMVQKLEESANALAQSEREGAWREMAKQVAHEIKNPLTPMKLSIQYLQRAIDNDLPNAKELTQNVAKTLITQIDELAKIAGDFSQFANIDNVVMEKVDISEKLDSIVQLYRQSESVVISYEPHPPVFVLGDKVQVSRLFTNLIKNAIEAVEGEVARIDITQMVTDGHVTLTIKDNGKGIEPELAGHIFQPNFTTKTSGTGLGLAISKGIVEKLKGFIGFQTELGKGTTFIIRLPIV